MCLVQIRAAAAVSRNRGFGDMQFGVRVRTVWVTLINDVHSPASANAVAAATASAAANKNQNAVTAILTGAAASVPVARLVLNEITAKFVAFGHSRTGMTTVDLGVQFWNGNLLEWEPLFEPWKVTASSMASLNTLSADHPQYHSMIVTSDKPANINLTQTMLKDCMDAVTVFAATTASVDPNKPVVAGTSDAAQPKPGVDEKQVWAPYLLENNTEVPVTVDIGYAATTAVVSPQTSAPLSPPESSGGASGPVPPISVQWDEKYGVSTASGVLAVSGTEPVRIVSTFEVPAYSQKPFFFRDSTDARGRMVVVTFHRSADKIVLPLSSVRYCRTHQIRMVNAKTGAVTASPYVVCKMSFIGASKVIKLHARCGIVNRTQTELHLAFPSQQPLQQQQLQYKFASDRIGPGQTLYLPIQAPSELAVFVVPGPEYKSLSGPLVLKHPLNSASGPGAEPDDGGITGSGDARAVILSPGKDTPKPKKPTEAEVKAKAAKKTIIATRLMVCKRGDSSGGNGGGLYHFSAHSKTLLEKDYTLVSIQYESIINLSCWLPVLWVVH